MSLCFPLTKVVRVNVEEKVCDDGKRGEVRWRENRQPLHIWTWNPRVAASSYYQILGVGQEEWCCHNKAKTYVYIHDYTTTKYASLHWKMFVQDRTKHDSKCMSQPVWGVGGYTTFNIHSDHLHIYETAIFSDILMSQVVYTHKIPSVCCLLCSC